MEVNVENGGANPTAGVQEGGYPASFLGKGVSLSYQGLNSSDCNSPSAPDSPGGNVTYNSHNYSFWRGAD